MADEKLTALTELDPPALSDILYIVDDPGGAPLSRKVTIQNVLELLSLLYDTSPQLGGDLEYNNHNQVFNTTLSSNETASGDIITVTFGESVTFGKLCYPDPDENEWMLALGTNVAAKHPAVGVALETKGNGQSGKLLLRGLIRSSTYFSTFGLRDSLWLSDGTSGGWVNDRPRNSGDIVQRVGWVPAANYAYFNPNLTYVELGEDDFLTTVVPTTVPPTTLVPTTT